jgi:hypothetical protein
MAGRVAELDLLGERPLVLVDEELLSGVASAVVEVNAHEVPVLVLRLVRFNVKGSTLPNGIRPEGARR